MCICCFAWICCWPHFNLIIRDIFTILNTHTQHTHIHLHSWCLFVCFVLALSFHMYDDVHLHALYSVLRIIFFLFDFFAVSSGSNSIAHTAQHNQWGWVVVALACSLQDERNKTKRSKRKQEKNCTSFNFINKSSCPALKISKAAKENQNEKQKREKKIKNLHKMRKLCAVRTQHLSSGNCYWNTHLLKFISKVFRINVIAAQPMLVVLVLLWRIFYWICARHAN